MCSKACMPLREHRHFGQAGTDASVVLPQYTIPLMVETTY